MSRTLRQLATNALQELGVVGRGRPTPQPYETTDAVNGFNALWRSLQGRVIGQRLRRDWDAAAGETADPGGLYAVNVSTQSEPANGTRLGVIGARTVTAADGTIEGAASVTTSASTSWFYREDLGDWKKETTLGLDDAHPFSSELDEALPFMLAFRLAGQFGHEITPLISAGNAQGLAQLRQLYGAKPIVRVDRALLRGVGHRHWNW